MNGINLFALQILIIPAISFGCLLETGCNDSDKKSARRLNQGPVAETPHAHDDSKHRVQIILDSHEFASKTCSYDANCDTGYRCDLRPRFHKGICVRKR